MKKIGFFGGSFDPIHLGHLNLAVQLLESGAVDEILFCPAYCSPFKIGRPPEVSGFHRLEMIRRVISDIPQFKVSSLEIDA
jgi:nicotinate-nucleotide adenylyltransferase